MGFLGKYGKHGYYAVSLIFTEEKDVLGTVCPTVGTVTAASVKVMGHL